MSAHFRNSLGSLYNRISPLFSDVGTSFLGIAALFFVRAFPPSASLEFDYWLLGASAVSFLLGLFLRASTKP